MKYRILKLSLINPGGVETNFALIRFKVDKEKAENVYKEFEPLIPDDVANAAYFCVSLHRGFFTVTPLAQSAIYIEKQ